jgi:hypothetical protein
MLTASPYVKEHVEREHEYLLLLRPSEEAMKKIKAGEKIRFGMPCTTKRSLPSWN